MLFGCAGLQFGPEKIGRCTTEVFMKGEDGLTKRLNTTEKDYLAILEIEDFISGQIEDMAKVPADTVEATHFWYVPVPEEARVAAFLALDNDGDCVPDYGYFIAIFPNVDEMGDYNADAILATPMNNWVPMQELGSEQARQVIENMELAE
jgi:hypothetical protein